MPERSADGSGSGSGSAARWLALASVPGLGGVTVGKLLARFGSLDGLFAASPGTLAEVPRVTPSMAEQLLAASLAACEAELRGLRADGIELLTWDDAGFPPRLHELPDRPLVLFARGHLAPADAQAVAIVGTRAPSGRGDDLARLLGRELASRGLTIVSGLARGIDAAAHRGALEAVRGRTLAVLGSGLRCSLPRDRAELAEQIVARGALLSELLPTTRPRGPHLMARDRIVSGLSRAVIVVEAGPDSGSLDTAARARKHGRVVCALPGSPGTDHLLAGGARPLEPSTASLDALTAELSAPRDDPRPGDHPPVYCQ